MALEVNKNLSWRDIQHLVAHNSDKINPNSTSWQRNGAGLMVSDNFGFGALNAGRLVEAARHSRWITSLEQHVCRSTIPIISLNGNNPSPVILKHTASCSSQSNCITKLEHVRLYVTLESYPRGGIEIKLISPSGTKSPILRQRREDKGTSFNNWGFMALTFWDEDPRGEWTVRIEQMNGSKEIKLQNIRLELFGTCEEFIPLQTTTEPATSSTSSSLLLLIPMCIVVAVVICFTLYFRHRRRLLYRPPSNSSRDATELDSFSSTLLATNT